MSDKEKKLTAEDLMKLSVDSVGDVEAYVNELLGKYGFANGNYKGLLDTMSEDEYHKLCEQLYS
jgi:hypothetical protein